MTREEKAAAVLLALAFTGRYDQCDICKSYLPVCCGMVGDINYCPMCCPQQGKTFHGTFQNWSDWFKRVTMTNSRPHD
jgi:hypothetical protein